LPFRAASGMQRNGISVTQIRDARIEDLASRRVREGL
jgi:hypothetical protein